MAVSEHLLGLKQTLHIWGLEFSMSEHLYVLQNAVITIVAH